MIALKKRSYGALLCAPFRRFPTFPVQCKDQKGRENKPSRQAANGKR